MKIKKTGEIVDVIGYRCCVMERKCNDEVSYVDSRGNEHFRENMNLYWDFDKLKEEDEDEEDEREPSVRNAVVSLLLLIAVCLCIIAFSK